MSGLAITITDKGRAALVAASGTKAVTIAAVGISAAAVVPTADATALAGEIKRLATFSGEVTDATTIHLTIRDDSTDSYALRAFALYLSDGTLFAIYGGSPQAASSAGQTDATIMEKSAGSMLMLAVDIAITGSDATAIAFGDTNFLNPAATTEVQGVVELATETETAAGTDAKRAVTPKGLLAAVSGWLDARFGAGAPSAFVKGLLAKVGAADILTALGIKSAAQHEAADFLPAANYTAADVLTKLTGVDGAGSGLDADTLDGHHAADFMSAYGIPDNSLIFINARVIRNSNSANANDGLYLGYQNSNHGVTRILGGGASAGGIEVSGPGYNDTTINGAIVWNSGNDGAGSGLDADTLDGKHAADFLSQTDIHPYAAYAATAVKNDWYGILLGTSANALAVMSRNDGKGGLYRQDLGNWALFFDGTNAFVGRSDTNLVWHAGNDGAGSGLDADTLDGLHADGFARVTASYASAAGGYRVWSDGYKECWGTVTAAANAYTTVTYPVAFASWSLAICTGGTPASDAKDNGPYVASAGTNTCTVYSSIDSAAATTWRAWGY